jgi:pimeloyl-ACP methyl ester carboxylesterase
MEGTSAKRETELAYVERGAGAPVVFVHGALGDYRSWGAQLDALSARYRVVAYSRRGHYPNGTRAGDDSPYTRAGHAADLAALLRALDLGPAHLVGHSYGAAVAALVAAEHPEFVRGLVLGEPSLFGVLEGHYDRALLARQRAAMEGVLSAARRGEHEVAVRSFVRAVTGLDVPDAFPAAGRAALSDNASTLGPMLETYYDTAGFDRERARRLAIPTLVVQGELSPDVNRRISNALAARVPGAELLVLPGASHGLHLEKPEEFNRALLAFLDEH